jgi:hypothetical protein
MPRLSDTQTTLLSAAAARKNRSLLPTPETLKAVGKTCDRAIVSLAKRGYVVETRARSEAATWRRDDGGARIGLMITPAGHAAIGVDEPECADGEIRTGAEQVDATPGRPGGKLGAVLAAVEAEDGATLGELAEGAAWQPHTTRAALSRLRQRGFDIRLETVGERKAYRLHAAG